MPDTPRAKVPARGAPRAPRRRASTPTLGFAAASMGLLLLVPLPLATTILTTPPPAVLAALVDGRVVASLVLTFAAGALATAVGLLGGIPLAYLLVRRSFPGKRLVEGLVDLPIVIPHTAAGVALLLVFGARGAVGGALAPLAISFVDSVPGIAVATAFVSVPFLVNGAREAFASVDPELEKVAEPLGATPWRAFWYVALPLA